MRISLEVREKNTGKRVAALYPPDIIPEDGATVFDLFPAAHRVWRMFCDLHEIRSCGFGGAEPISYGAMRDYQSMTGARFERDDARLIRALDRCWLESEHKYRLRMSEQS